MIAPYDLKPAQLFKYVGSACNGGATRAYCVGFEFRSWRCDAYAEHLMEWIQDYALKADELKTINHTNCYVRLQEAATRVYTSEKYEKRGEVGEITAHAICRTFFETIPFADRIHYLSASNDPVKAFDLAHVRYLEDDKIELWLGEAKFYQDRVQAIKAAITSVREHLDQGFLKNEKLLLGPQVTSNIPHSEKIREVLSKESSLDELFETAVFPIIIAAESDAFDNHEKMSNEYKEEITDELKHLNAEVIKSGLDTAVKILLIYVPLETKEKLAKAFDDRLKGVQK